jgi:hypothetical protein
MIYYLVMVHTKLNKFRHENVDATAQLGIPLGGLQITTCRLKFTSTQS